MSWLYYERDYVQLSADYLPLDTASRPMEKREFLSKLKTGNYLPVRMKTMDSSFCYQLYRMDERASNDIREAIKVKALKAYNYLQLEGSALPQFNFVDLNGKVYNRQTTEGKVVAINCWFMHCQACNEEMPELNKIVEQTKGRNDVVFIGLAFDKADSLRMFLSKRKFDYAIVPEKENYMMNDLGIISYPTHIILDRQGKIKKVIDGGVNEFINALNTELTKKS